jgi:hypothetical protein
MMGRGPLQILDGHDEARFKPAALLHLFDGQSFAPLTAMGLRQVREWTSLLLKPWNRLNTASRTAGALWPRRQVPGPHITNQDSSARHVAGDHEFAQLKNTIFCQAPKRLRGSYRLSRRLAMVLSKLYSRTRDASAGEGKPGRGRSMNGARIRLSIEQV